MTLLGCGEAEVAYAGTVVEGEVSGYTFDDRANPTAGASIENATVELCVDGGCQEVHTAADGHFSDLGFVFGGVVGADTDIAITATAPDGRSVKYEAVFEDTDDPTFFDEDSPRYLNFTLAPQ